MEKIENKYVTVSYELFTKDEEGKIELVEKAPVEHPFQFITGMGVTLEAFENNVANLSEGENFDFTIGMEDAYGPYVEEHVIELGKDIFTIDGHFDSNTIYPGNVVPLVNEDGNRFQGLVLEVSDTKVKLDLNDPLAGKELRFKGQVVTSRPATEAEMKEMLAMMSGEEGCGGSCEGCGGGCNCEH
ncbi:FKBP-type peptidyl-prolyl cis-trans isomerase [Alloprevotella rava]|uniref:Peptidyl-prolyl cis-trans isomerase n=2 Tax=Alloprevotella rava TaxID=671218 RepID=G5GA22_9BACT|nr:FKBP-type peptidyl-prolyl cis-trans isomerase [Alloprevotella rava]EHG24222.1 hypothetical protein HMPREF9332_00423 [Alloprevotella rava F0323]MBB3702660.1 FKBP-type peptidyl-prolyl cis-trans isomerase SlyD [Alloprevotella rava]